MNGHVGNTLDEVDEQSSGDESDDSFNSALGSPSSVPRTSSVPGSPASASGSISGDSSSDAGGSSSDSGGEGSDSGGEGSDPGGEGSDAGEQEHGDRLSELNSPSTPKHSSIPKHSSTPKHSSIPKHSSTPKHPFAGASKIEVLHDRGVIDVEEEVRAYAALRRAASEDAMHERFLGPSRANTTSNTFSVRPRRRPRSPSPAPTSIVLADHSGESAAFARDVRIPGWTCVGAGPGGYVVYECVVATRERPDSYAQASTSSSNTPAPRQRTTSFMPTSSSSSSASSFATFDSSSASLASASSSSSTFTFTPATPFSASPFSASASPFSPSPFPSSTPSPRPPSHRRQKSTPGPTIRVYKRYSEFAALDHELRQTLPMAARAHVPPLPPANALARFRPRFLASRRAQLEAWLMRVLLHPDIGGTRAVREWMCV
ncbi:uncharacterized protein SCHCODRAFT_02616900 [Schizophyllum commune H4-8]|nr:uncharacterized protein SCHCODRAFT_02616900 [Schizophyllum commune H4-8]KAI5897178.1 hypothetical protein SCHCODRAFT_02616900 [Schizophyllum commune H4-8]